MKQPRILSRRSLLALAVIATLGASPGIQAQTPAKAQVIPTFPIVRFVIEGNSLLPAAIVDGAVASFTGPKRDFGDVQKAVEALEGVYRRNGLTSVSVLLPEQVLERGEILLKVVESRIKEVRVPGQQHFDVDNIRASLPGAREGAIPKLEELSASLRVANENPFKKLKLQMQPGERDEDVNAVITVTDEKPWKLGLSLDNSGSPQTGRHRLGFSYQNGNLFNRDQVLTMQYQTSPEKPKDVNVYVLAYRIPLYSLGDVVDVYATKSDVNAGTVAAGPFNLAITGKGTAMGAKYTWKLKRVDDYDHELILGLDEKVFQNSITASGVDLGSELRVRPMSATYAGKLTQEGRELGLSLGLNYNLGGGNNGDQAAISLARTGATRHYSVLRGGLTFSQALAEDWQWRISSSAQWADTPLVPGEQLGVGGAASVRGFLEREVAFDKGVQGNVEIYSPELCGKSLPGQQCRVVAFYDFGMLSRNQPQTGEDARENVSSAGLGLRWTVSKDFAIQADYANVLNGTVSRPSGNWRFHGRVGWFF